MLAYTNAEFSSSNGYSNAQFEAESLGPPCYCRGTKILTVHGEVPVEDLKIGDRIHTLFNAVQPVKWIGKRSYSARFILGRRDILPIGIRAEAFAPNIPHRDLWVSPHHAIVFLHEGNGVLIEAAELVNGTSIIRSSATNNTIDYFHIELEAHDVLIAEGALAESFLDEDSRAIFHNEHAYHELYDDKSKEPARYCVPRYSEGIIVETIRQVLSLRDSKTFKSVAEAA